MTDTISVAAIGDMYIKRPDPETIYALAAEALRSADIAFGNLEVAMSNVGAPIAGKFMGTMKSPETSMRALTDAGFDVVALANNHSMDYGADALLRTIELLDQAGIAHCGGGRNLDEARKPAILERKGVRVAFLSYSSVYEPAFAAAATRPGIATVKVHTAYQPSPRVFEQPGSPPVVLTIPDPAERERMEEDIRQAKQKADAVVIAWHWGVSQGYRKLVPYQVELGHVAVDAGADLIVGHHAHVIQPVEVYKGRAIFYGVAQFGFEMDTPHFGHETMMVRAQVGKGGVERVGALPAYINDKLQPEVLDLERGKAVVAIIRELSGEFGTRFAEQGQELVVQTG